MDKKLVSKIEDALKRKKDKQTQLEDRIARAEADIAKAKEKATAATAADDEKGFVKAMDSCRFNEDVIRMYTAKLNDNKTSISKADCRAMITEIKKDVNSTSAQAEQKAADLISQLYKITCEFESEINIANALIEKWVNQSGHPDMNEKIPKTTSELIFLKNEIDRHKTRTANHSALYMKVGKE